MLNSGHTDDNLAFIFRTTSLIHQSIIIKSGLNKLAATQTSCFINCLRYRLVKLAIERTVISGTGLITSWATAVLMPVVHDRLGRYVCTCCWFGIPHEKWYLRQERHKNWRWRECAWTLGKTGSTIFGDLHFLPAPHRSSSQPAQAGILGFYLELGDLGCFYSFYNTKSLSCRIKLYTSKAPFGRRRSGSG